MADSNEEAAEDTYLLESNSDTSSLQSNPPDVLLSEMERPWPSTFERSMNLLASPLVPKDKAELYTRSPKAGSSPAVLARRTNLDRGFYSPEKSKFFSNLQRRFSEHDGPSAAGISSSLTKLDIGLIQNLQDERKKSAQQYRAEILKKQPKKKTSKLPKKADGKATLMQCGFNLANILMGVGLLGLPYVFKVAGWYGGLLCIVSFGFITWRTAILIGRELNGDPRPSSYFDDSPYKSPLVPGSCATARMLRPITGFPDIARVAFGNVGSLVLAIVLYFELFSCIAIFFVSMGDHVHTLFDGVPQKTAMILVASLSLIPTIVLRTPALLSYLSMVGTFATVAVVASVIASAVSEGDMTEKIAGDGNSHHAYWRPQGLSLAFGLVAYCFSGHAIVPSIYTSMEKPQEYEKMVTYTFLIVILCCIAVASAGYYMFGDTVLDQVTLSLEANSTAVLAMKCLTWLMILTAFSKTTLTMFPLALGIEEIVAPYLTDDWMVDACASVVKLTMTALALLVSICFPSFSYLCALVGMVCTMTVSVIFPAAAHVKLFGSRLSASEKLLDAIFVVVGLAMAVIGTIAAF